MNILPFNNVSHRGCCGHSKSLFCFYECMKEAHNFIAWVRSGARALNALCRQPINLQPTPTLFADYPSKKLKWKTSYLLLSELHTSC